MHDDFADWYRAATLNPSDIPLAARWEAVETLVPDLDADAVLDVARIYFRLDPTEAGLGRFRRAFKANDPTFRMQENDLELSVLAGAVLVHLLGSRRTSLAQIGALGVIAGGFAGRREQTGVEDLVERSRVLLSRRSSDLRTLERETSHRFMRLDDDQLAQSIIAQGDTGSTQALSNATAETFRSVIEAMNDLRTGLARMLRDVRQSQRFLAEETNVLWWVFGGWSRDLESRFSDMDLGVVALAAGRELASFAAEPSGPLAAEAFLDNVLRQSDPKLAKKVNLKDAINAAPRNWREKAARRSRPHVEALTPALLAIAKSTETEGSEDWIPAYQRASGVDASKASDSLALALALYHEEMLLRALEEK
jgi:hypothetical protein